VNIGIGLGVAGMVLTGIVESSEGVVSAGMWVSLVEGSPA